MQRYFVEPNQVSLDRITIIGEDYHHIKNVMRMVVGANVYVSDEINSFLCEIESFTSDTVICKIINKLEEDKELKNHITIAHGLVRKEKIETVIDNITELGADYYLPVVMEYSVVKFNKDDFNKKIVRLNKIAKEASEQSHRIKKLRVCELVTFKELIKMKDQYDLLVVAYEKCDVTANLNDLLKDMSGKNILFLVGPEGGISLNEVEVLKANGFKFVSLGSRILRTEVAPSYIMSCVDIIERM